MAITDYYVSGLAATLVGDIDDSTVNPTVQFSPVSAFKQQVDNTPGNDMLLTSVLVTVSADEPVIEGDKAERMWCTGGTETTVANGDTVVEYAVTHRGLLNKISNATPQASDSVARNYRAHTNGDLVVLDEQWLTDVLNQNFTAGTTTNTEEAGEDIDARETVSLHTDGKLYLYHSTNYPNLVGIANASATTGNDCTYTTFGGLSTGHSGLTIGANQYAEGTGAITETPSATTRQLGTAETATTIRIAATVVPDLKITTKGDLLTYSTAATRLGVGTDGQVLEVDSSEATGIKWSDKNVEFADDTFRIQDNTDATKEIAFEASGITTGNTRTITMPDEDVSLLTLGLGTNNKAQQDLESSDSETAENTTTTDNVDWDTYTETDDFSCFTDGTDKINLTSGLYLFEYYIPYTLSRTAGGGNVSSTVSAQNNSSDVVLVLSGDASKSVGAGTGGSGTLSGAALVKDSTVSIKMSVTSNAVGTVGQLTVADTAYMRVKLIRKFT
jgi:hypothetical protein